MNGKNKNVQIHHLKELSLKKSYEIQKISKMGYWEANLSTGELFWSDIIFEMFGFDSDFVPTVEIFRNCIHPDDVNLVLNSELESEYSGTHDVVHRIIKKNGEIRYVHELAKRFEENGEILLRGTVQDVTDYKLAEEKIKNLLLEKETFIKEIHHRIKNSLQQIHALLGIQSENAKFKYNLSNNITPEGSKFQAELQKILLDARQRIFAISIVHEMFYTRNSDVVDFSDFLNILFNNIKITYAESHKNINFYIYGDSLRLHLEHIVPCGLIVNEIISNSFKHAFVNKENGNITIKSRIEGSTYFLSIEDDGIGINENSIKFNRGLGLSLIYGLTEQLGGKVNLKYDSSGTKYEISFDKKYLKG